MNTPQAPNAGVLDYRKQGYLAYVHCGKRLPLTILKANRWYIGTADDEGPCSRESNEYFDSFEDASAALKHGQWTQKQNP